MILEQESMFSSDYPDSNCAQQGFEANSDCSFLWAARGAPLRKRFQTDLNDVIVMRSSDQMTSHMRQTIPFPPVFSGVF